MALSLREKGPADALCIVFLHGLWLSSAMWQPQFERLSNTYHCLAPDLPEHGKSTDIGLSLGGSVALRLLHDVPEVVDHLVVSGTAARLSPVIAALSKLGKPLLHILKPAPLISLALGFTVPQPYLSVLREDVRHLKPEAIIHVAGALVKTEVLRGVQVPVLVAVGKKEDFMAKRAARELSRTIPAQAVMAPGVGHIWNLEAPDLFTETVLAWITDQPLPPALVRIPL